MINLAIECSGIAGSVALFRNEKLVSTSNLSPGASSVQTLAPEIRVQLSQANIASVDLISVTTGPGSFTGLRVGLATAKMLGFAWRCPIAAVDTLESIALRGSKHVASSGFLLPTINAFRKQLFVGCWLTQRGELRRCTTSHLANAEDWQADPTRTFAAAWVAPQILPPAVPRLPNGSQADNLATELSLDGKTDTLFPCWLTGPGLEKYISASCRRLQAELWHPRAIEVGEIGLRKHEQNQLQSALSLRANYVRASAAEENARAGASRPEA